MINQMLGSIKESIKSALNEWFKELAHNLLYGLSTTLDVFGCITIMSTLIMWQMSFPGAGKIFQIALGLYIIGKIIFKTLMISGGA